MSPTPPVSFIRQEIVGSLPSGWGLLDDGGRWDSRRGTWTIAVYDPADNSWDLQVDGGAVARLGRVEALRQAIDRIYREALG